MTDMVEEIQMLSGTARVIKSKTKSRTEKFIKQIAKGKTQMMRKWRRGSLTARRKKRPKRLKIKVMHRRKLVNLLNAAVNRPLLQPERDISLDRLPALLQDRMLKRKKTSTWLLFSCTLGFIHETGLVKVYK